MPLQSVADRRRAVGNVAHEYHEVDARVGELTSDHNVADERGCTSMLHASRCTLVPKIICIVSFAIKRNTIQTKNPEPEWSGFFVLNTSYSFAVFEYSLILAISLKRTFSTKIPRA